MASDRLWVLGGNDGEMEAIKTLLGMAGEKWVQPKTNWGDHRFSPRDAGLGAECSSFANCGFVKIVFVECCPALESSNTLVVDHHGQRSGEPPAVLQVLAILEKSGLRVSDATQRWLELVGANDCGAYNGMEGIGATVEEMKRVRAFTRKAQGITSEHESVARTALYNAKQSGRALVIIGTQIKTACVVDELYWQGRCDEEFLIVNSGSFHFSGDGETCRLLKEKFAGWAGGAGLGKKGDKRAFWGCNNAASKASEILAEINR